jgi:hypothetical protein
VQFPGWKEAWCVKCNAHRVSTKRGKCINCGEKLAPKEGANTFGAIADEKAVGAYSGKQRDSREEAKREPVLQALSNAGRITDLDLKPSSYALEVYGTGAVDQLLSAIRAVNWPEVKKAAAEVERSRQKIGGYTPDFQYRDHAGELVVEDVKGWKVSRDFPLRKKLMVACHNVEIQVIRNQRGVQQFARGTGVKGRGVGARLMGGK